ncbi:hypothetical protein COV42_01015 [Candidatus Campbellbacteria bacterium CG11_big_fil_rev_8_21_14_0_20_44_21]|nr:MAG: hypothetical protein COV42_01015 [Candidatus Campbellbacteria bacterium CG11_big_fil_rev_8_21_14_0_20_44_21]
MPRSFFKNFFLFCLALFFFLPFLFSEADTIGELRSKIDDRNRRLEEIQAEIARYEKDLEKVGAEKSTLQNAIKELNLTRSKLLAEISKTQTEINNESLNIERLNLEIKEKESRINQNNKAIAEALRKIREMDNISIIEGVLSEQKLSEFWETFETLQRFQIGLKEDLDILKELRDALSKNRKEVESRKQTLIYKRNELGGKKEVVEENKKEKDTLLVVTKNKEANYQGLLDEKIRQREQFERELFEYESQLQFVLDPSRIPPAGEGILRWPLDHIRITQQFGKTSDSGRLYASGTHNGVDFGASVGTNVYAALSGTVTGLGNTDQYRGCLSYGRWVLIKHDNGLSSLYAHLSGFAVSGGQRVETGQIIGYSGNTGYSTGPHLHLTLFASQGVELTKLGDIPGRPITKCSSATIPVAPKDAYLDPLVYL